jgi:hypothetical protein
MSKKVVRKYSVIRKATFALLALVAAIVLLPPAMHPISASSREYCSFCQQYTAPMGGATRRNGLGFVDELGNAFRFFGSSLYWAREYSSYGICEPRTVRKVRHAHLLLCLSITKKDPHCFSACACLLAVHLFRRSTSLMHWA